MQTISDILPYRKVCTSRIWTLPYYLTPKGTLRQRTQLLVWKWKRKMRTDWALKRKKNKYKNKTERGRETVKQLVNKQQQQQQINHSVWILWDTETTPLRRTLRARDHVTRARYFKFLWRVRLCWRVQVFFVFFARVCSFLFTLCCLPFSRLFIGIKFGVWAYHSRRTFS